MPHGRSHSTILWLTVPILGPGGNALATMGPPTGVIPIAPDGENPPTEPATEAASESVTESATETTTTQGIVPADEQAPAQGRSGSSVLSGALMAASMVIVVWVLLRLARQRRVKIMREVEPTERLEQIRHDASQREVFSNLMVDAEELTRRFAAQLDNKAERLEQLLALADERIERLERAARQAGGSASTNGSAGADPTTLEIYRLADEGHNPVEIARTLGQHTGKVELILALREG